MKGHGSMIRAIYIKGEDLTDAFFIRKKVFIEEQKIDVNIDFDDLDKDAIHVVAYEDNYPVGTGRLINKENIYIIGRIAVLKEKRGNYYGDLIVRMLIKKAFDSGAEFVDIHSQLSAISFYKKIGFKEYGKKYVVASIEHIDMRLLKENFKTC
jgi:predicted GNAT family N-acyltransferase